MTKTMAITERGLGYVGLFLIGALSWAADRLGPADPSTRVPRSARRPGAAAPRAFHHGVSVPVIQRTNG